MVNYEDIEEAHGPEKPKTIDLEDPDYLLEARIFNAITIHPGHTLYFSERDRITKKVVAYTWRQINRRERQVARRIWWFERRLWIRRMIDDS